MDPVEIMLKEYETLRQESLEAIKNRNSVLAFGLAAISAIVAACVATVEAATETGAEAAAHGVAIFALTALVPAVSLFVLVAWLGEHKRSRRVGTFLAGLEERINEKAGKTETLLTWESEHLAGKHMMWPYCVVPLLLVFIGYGSFLVGAAGVTNLNVSINWADCRGIADEVVAIVVLVVTLWFMHQLDRDSG